MALLRVSSLPIGGGIFLPKHLSTLPGRTYGSVSVDLAGITKRERKCLRTAMMTGYLDASTRTRTASIYGLLCGKFDLPQIILHGSKGASSAHSCLIQLNDNTGSHVRVKALERVLEPLFGVMGNMEERKNRSYYGRHHQPWKVNDYRGVLYFNFPNQEGMKSHAFYHLLIDNGVIPKHDAIKALPVIGVIDSGSPITYEFTGVWQGANDMRGAESVPEV